MRLAETRVTCPVKSVIYMAGMHSNSKLYIRVHNNNRLGAAANIFPLIWPHLEYANMVWSPYRQKYIEGTEKV
jgi:hypothetical protein